MKRITFLLLALLLLAGCAPGEDKHPEWGADLVRIGEDMAAKTPEGFALLENNDALAPGGIYYVSWSSGEGRTITNGEGKEAAAYDAQLFVLLKECADEGAARGDVSDWMDREGQNYELGEAAEQIENGQSFTVLPLLSARGDNPYARGVAAFGVRNNCAVSVELLCADDFSEDTTIVLTSFLQGLHY